MFTRNRAAWAATCVLACSAPTNDGPTTFSTTPLGTAPSSSGAMTMTVYAPQDGVVQGLNTLELVVTKDDAPVDGLTIDLVPWMPAMGHGTSVVPVIQPTGSGRYIASDVGLIMPGTWELRTTLMSGEQATVAVSVP